ncbi:MAG: amidase [Actinomycetota bacterium]|nr:amidase [Actinomycetota bacterium]MED5293553.1 amidase [Actinomycetota bacterium]
MSNDYEVVSNNDLIEELERVQTRDSVVRAWVSRHSDDNIIKAFEVAPDGLLSGWTVGVKDVINTFDLPTERGSPIYRGNQPVGDAACVAMAREAGAVVTGKTVTTEFALFTPNITTNPHDPSRTPGGSSSGSAAAVADRQVRAAFGTQTVGSVIRPAAFCGVVGFKPTRRLVPLAGVATLSHAFDTLGWFTRDVADSTTMFQAMTGVGASPQDLNRKVGRYLSHQWDAAAPETLDAIDSSCAALEAAGVEVIDVDPLPHLELVFDAANTILHYEIVRVFAWERTHHLDLISELVRKMFVNAAGIDHQDYLEARTVLLSAQIAHQEFMAANHLDALLTPSAPGEAPPLKTTGDSVFNRVWTSLGVPTVHIPVRQGPSGLPVGVQLVGQSWGDQRLLATAAVAEESFGIAT